VTALHFFALLRIELCSRKEPATVRSRERQLDSIEPDFYTRPSFNHWRSQARDERPRQARHSAGYALPRPANWPGRQYTNLCRFIASGRRLPIPGRFIRVAFRCAKWSEEDGMQCLRAFLL